MAGLFIDDGYTLTQVLPARGPVPALKVDYRPALPARYNRWLKAKQTAKDSDADLAADISLLCDQLANWDAGKPLNEVWLRKLWPQTLVALVDLVTGHVVPDGSGKVPLEQAEKNSPAVSSSPADTPR